MKSSRTGWAAVVALALVAGGCAANGMSTESGCEGVVCSLHGTCLVGDDGAPRCACDETFESVGLSCVAAAGTCVGITCDDHGSCLELGDGPVCTCAPGYVNGGATSCTPSTAACSAGGWCVEPLPPTMQTPALLAATAVGKGEVWAVGEAGTVQHFDGQRWASVPVPTTVTLRAVFGDRDHLWVAGDDGVILRRTDRAWVLEHSAPGQRLRAIWGSPAGGLWVGGSFGPEPLLLHGSGGDGWRRIGFESPDTRVPFHGVIADLWGSGDDDAWAVGAYHPLGASLDLIMRFDGEEWTRQYLERGYGLHAVWGTGPDDVWAVGELGRVVHYDGRAFESGGLAGRGALTSLWGAAGNDVWAGGPAGLVHYDGDRWVEAASWTDTEVTAITGGAGRLWLVGTGGAIHEAAGREYTRWVTELDRPLRAVDGRSSRDLWAVGEALLHRDTSGWVESMRRLGAPAIEDVHAFAEGGAWAVGERGTILRHGAAGWATSPSPLRADLKAVWGDGERAFAAGAQGALLSYQAGRWSVVAPATSTPWLVSAPHLAIGFVAPGDPPQVGSGPMYALGSAGLTPRAAPAMGGDPLGLGVGPDPWAAAPARPVAIQELPRVAPSYRAAAGSSATDVWVVGDAGAVSHFDGTAWTRRDAPTAAMLRGVWAPQPDAVFVVGDDGALMRFDGKSWRTVLTPARAALRVVTGTSLADMWIAGDRGFVAHYDGDRWRRIDSGTWATIEGLFVETNGLWADATLVTGNGTVMRRSYYLDPVSIY